MNLIMGISFFLTLALGIPIAFVLGITALVAVIALSNVPLHLIPQRLFTGMDSFPIMAVPFFILAGNLMNAAKITDSIIEFSKLLVGRIRGGLGHVNIVASMFFAGISGSAVADTSALGSILIPAMEKEGYSTPYSAAVTASSSIIGPIIPPSIPMVIMAMIANLSVGGLFLGGGITGYIHRIWINGRQLCHIEEKELSEDRRTHSVESLFSDPPGSYHSYAHATHYFRRHPGRNFHGH